MVKKWVMSTSHDLPWLGFPSASDAGGPVSSEHLWRTAGAAGDKPLCFLTWPAIGDHNYVKQRGMALLQSFFLRI